MEDVDLARMVDSRNCVDHAKKKKEEVASIEEEEERDVVIITIM